MSDSHSSAAPFETHRPHLLAVATRLLGSPTEAADAVQEAWLRLGRTDTEGITNLGGWLTTVVSRICLDLLRSRSTRSEEAADPELAAIVDEEPSPEDASILNESAAEALAIVLDTLTPIERVTFILHDVFAVRFEEIAEIIDRSPGATRQVASRARQRVRRSTAGQDQRKTAPGEIVAAFFAAAREGRFDTLIQLLAPDVVLRADATTVAMGGVNAEIVGARGVAETFSGRAHAARLAMIDGQPGATWAPGGKPRVVFRFTIADGAIVAVEMIAAPEILAEMDVQLEPKTPASGRSDTTSDARPTS